MHINIPISLVYESVFRVASMGTDNRYAPIDAPRKRIQILRNIGIFVQMGNYISCRNRDSSEAIFYIATIFALEPLHPASCDQIGLEFQNEL